MVKFVTKVPRSSIIKVVTHVKLKVIYTWNARDIL